MFSRVRGPRRAGLWRGALRVQCFYFGRCISTCAVPKLRACFLRTQAQALRVCLAERPSLGGAGCNPDLCGPARSLTTYPGFCGLIWRWRLQGESMATAILKTSALTLPGVVEHAKHALHGEPNDLNAGDTILIAQTLQDLRFGQRQIRYKMTFVRARRDTGGETDRIWGAHWPWIIDGTNLKELARPFNMRSVQVTKANYAQGGTVFYVDPLDEQALATGGYLKGIGE